MKKLKFLFVVLLLSIITMSCSKDPYTVNIDVTQTVICNYGVNPPGSRTTITFTGTEDEINQYCESLNTSVSTTSGGYTCTTATTAVVIE